MKQLTQFMLIALLSVAVLSACKTKKAKGSPAVPSDFALELLHSGCRGNCPTYTLSVGANGAAKYEGKRSVDMMGSYSKTLGAATITEMVKAINASNFWDFDDVYGGEIADAPGIHTTVTMDGKTKTVKDIRNAPQALKDLEAKLEELFGKNDWIQPE
jgi:hypothetical protein